MWPRKQLDIGWTDLAFGLIQVVAPARRPSVGEVIGSDWIPADEAVLSLSVRSGLDLLLRALKLPAGSEVIMSGVTIPDMARIVEQHGLVTVPVDVDAATLQPVQEQIEHAIIPRTRAILVAHLFGSHIEMGPIVEFAHQHDLVVIEDCAQAFVGSGYAGHMDSDCALFSFGPIKTATALGGAVVRLRDPEVRSRMLELQSAYPIQTRRAYFKRLAKYAAFRFLCKPLNYGLMVRVFGWFRVEYDRALGHAAHSFGKANFFSQIRRQPSLPLLRMLQRRILSFERRGLARLERRAQRGNLLSGMLPAGMVVGDQNLSNTFWVMPVRVGNKDAVLAALRDAGFDATGRSSLIVVQSPDGWAQHEAPIARWLSDTIFLPSDETPDRDWERLVSILRDVAVAVPVSETRELAALSGVSAAG